MKEKTKLGNLLSKKMELKTSICLSENTIAELIDKKLSLTERENAFEHLNSCKDCFEVYQISSSISKRNNKKSMRIPLSIAASIIIVFFIGIYHNMDNPTKLEFDKTQVYKPKVKSIIKVTQDLKEKSLVLEKEETKTKSEMVRSKKKIVKMQKVDRLNRGELKDEETFSSQPTVFLRKPEKNINQNISKKESNAVLNKTKISSEFTVLSNQGFIHNNINNFGKLNDEQTNILLSKWEEMLLKLKGTEKKIAKETIVFLRKQQMINNKR